MSQQQSIRFTTILLLLLVAASCSATVRMQSKQQQAREAAEVGLTSHPEFAELRESLARLERILENVNLRITGLEEGRVKDREGERDDMEKVIEMVAKQVEELKAEIAKGRPR